MSKNWISNTIFLHGFNDIQELFSFLSQIRDLPRNEDSILLPQDNTIDLEYMAVNISNIQNKLRLSLSFLTNNNIARMHLGGLFPSGFEHLKLTYAVIDTRTQAVELYNFNGSEITSHKSVPRGLGGPLLSELERLPDPERNVCLNLQELDVLSQDEFVALTNRILPTSPVE